MTCRRWRRRCSPTGWCWRRRRRGWPRATSSSTPCQRRARYETVRPRPAHVCCASRRGGGRRMSARLIAFVFDAAPLFVPAVGMLALGGLAPAWVWLAAAGASAQRRMETGRVIEDEPLQATIAVRRGRLGLGGWGSFEVVDPLTSSHFELREELSPLRGDRRADVRVVARFHRRGLHRLAGAVADAVRSARAGAGGEPERRRTSRRCSFCRRPSPSAGCGPTTAAACGCRRATTAPRRWRPSTSTACVRTAPGPRPRGFTGRRLRAGPA